MSKIEVNTVAPQCGTTLTLGESGDTVTLGTGASQSGFGRTGTVDWQTGSIKTATFTAASGEGYFCNTAGGAFEVDLPAGSAGAIVSVQDYNNTFDSNALTVDPNGSEKINGGSAGDAVILNTEGQGVTFVYIDATVGWRSVQDNQFAQQGASFIVATGGTITTVCTNFKVHTFTGPGTFAVSSGSGPAAIVDYMVVAGGGGAARDRSGGGGAGGYREAKTGCNGTYTASPLANPSGLQITGPVSIPITIGGGGAADNSSPYDNPGSGSNSIFSTITSTGGGAGRRTAPQNGDTGGSGGGGGYSCSTNGNGGAGNTPPVSPPQGNPGGNASYPKTGGGGGATGAGANGSGPKAGGPGATSSITSSPVGRAGGGGGIASGSGADGGGNGSADCSPTTAGGNGTVNTGGGAGGGGSNVDGGSGGSGIVVIRYKFQ